MRLDHLLLLVHAGLAAAVWLTLPALLPAATPGVSAALAVGVFALLAAAQEIAVRGRQVAALRADTAELKRVVRDAEEEVLWARRELSGLVGALRARHEATPEARALDEARAEVRMMKSVVTRLETETAAPEPRPLRVDPKPAAVSQADPQAVLAAVRAALKHDRIDLVLQPVVTLPQRRRRYYECLSRLRDTAGETLLPETYIPVAERAGLMAAVDNMLLLRCIQLVRRIQRKGERIGFVCNLSAHTLKDQAFFGDFVDYLEANPELAASLVFEMAQADFAALGPEAEAYLGRLWHRGARLSVDAVADLDLDATALAARHVDFVKVPAARLLERAPEAMRALRERLAAAEIDLVAERIESEEQLVELLDLGIDYGQGFLFGEPRPARLAA